LCMPKGAHDVFALVISWEKIRWWNTLQLAYLKHLKHKDQHWQAIYEPFWSSMAWPKIALLTLKMKVQI
jgi:hypothetical protein